jgi:hypothetical protein
MRLIAATLVLILAIPARAADRRQIAAINVAATSFFTYLGCLVQKRVQTRRDAVRCLAGGAVAGVGFYQAKRFASRGDITTGWLVANAATSIVENTTAGEHPLARLGYSFGPFRLRVVTPADTKRESLVDVDISAIETAFLAHAYLDADDFDVRDAMVWWETRQPITEDDVTFQGYTWGLFPGTWEGARSRTWSHEAVHAIQALQLDSVEPPALTMGRSYRGIRIRHVRAGAVNLTDNLLQGRREYHDRWAEIEAYRLTDDRRPPR